MIKVEFSTSQTGFRSQKYPPPFLAYGGRNVTKASLALGMYFLETMVPKSRVVECHACFLLTLMLMWKNKVGRPIICCYVLYQSLCRASASHQTRLFPEKANQVRQHGWLNKRPDTQGAVNESPSYTGAR